MRVGLRRGFVAWVAMMPIGACFPEPSYVGRLCTPTTGCPSPLVCLEGTCEYSRERSRDADTPEEEDSATKPDASIPDGSQLTSHDGGTCAAPSGPTALEIVNDCAFPVIARESRTGCEEQRRLTIVSGGSVKLDSYNSNHWKFSSSTQASLLDEVDPHGTSTEVTLCHRLMHRFSFNSSLEDAKASRAAELSGDVALGSNSVTFGGGQATVSLPIAQTLSTLENATFELWATWAGPNVNGQQWVRLLDFGVDQTHHMLLTPVGRTGFTRFGIKTPSSTTEDYVDGPGFVVGVETHIAVTFDAAHSTQALYVNGALVGKNTAARFTPASLGVPPNNWLGRSPNPNDAYFRGSISELRVYRGALSAAELAASYRLGPDSP